MMMMGLKDEPETDKKVLVKFLIFPSIRDIYAEHYTTWRSRFISQELEDNLQELLDHILTFHTKNVTASNALSPSSSHHPPKGNSDLPHNPRHHTFAQLHVPPPPSSKRTRASPIGRKKNKKTLV